jgi:hypothetical protein
VLFPNYLPKGINRQASIKFRQNLSRVGVKYFVIHRFINTIRNKAGLIEQWRNLIIPLCKKREKTGCRRYSGLPVLVTECKL